MSASIQPASLRLVDTTEGATLLERLRMQPKRRDIRRDATCEMLNAKAEERDGVHEDGDGCDRCCSCNKHHACMGHGCSYEVMKT